MMIRTEMAAQVGANLLFCNRIQAPNSQDSFFRSPISLLLAIANPVNILAPNDQFIPGVAQSVKGRTLTIQDSLQIKAAEYWLKLGEADWH
jgi:hypothetical protein